MPLLRPHDRCDEGVAWEMRRLAENGLLDRTILIVPPVSDGELGRRWKAIVNSLAKSGTPSLPLAPPSGSLCVTFAGAGGCHFVVSGEGRTVTAYEDALSHAIAILKKERSDGEQRTHD